MALKYILADDKAWNIYAVELNPEKAKTIHQDGILLKDHVAAEDGFNYLFSSQNKHKFDLIVVSDQDPSLVDEKTGQLIQAARNALSKNGKLLIYSDDLTMEKVQAFLKARQYLYERSLSKNGLHDIIILSRQAM